MNRIENRANPAILYKFYTFGKVRTRDTEAGMVTRHEQKLFQGPVKITGFTNPGNLRGGMVLVVSGMYRNSWSQSPRILSTCFVDTLSTFVVELISFNLECLFRCTQIIRRMNYLPCFEFRRNLRPELCTYLLLDPKSSYHEKMNISYMRNTRNPRERK